MPRLIHACRGRFGVCIEKTIKAIEFALNEGASLLSLLNYSDAWSATETRPQEQNERVSVRRRHSVNSLAAATDTHPKTVRNFLLHNGLIPANPLKAVIVSVDAGEGESLAAAMKAAVAQIHLPKVLNTTRGQVVQMIESGLLPPISGVKGGPGRSRVPIAMDVVQRFLADISRKARVVETAPEGTFGIPETAQISRVTSTNILHLLLAEGLTRVFQLADVPGYGGLLVDPVEVRTIANREVPEVAISAYRIVDRLEMFYAVVKALMADQEGGALLPTVPGSGAAKAMVRIDVVNAFVRNHVGLLRLSKETGVHHIKLRRKLDAAGIQPINDPERLRARIYRREDVQSL